MNILEYNLSIIPSEATTISYTAAMFDEIASDWNIRMYLTRPGSEEPIDELGDPLMYAANLSPDEIFDNLLKKHSDAWKRLSVM